MTGIDSVIEPTNNKQRKELKNNIKVLKITLPQEIFVLKCILSFDWDRKLIIQSIENIKYSKGLGLTKFRVICTAPASTTDYSISNPFDLTGWDETMTLEDKKYHVYNKLYTYLR